MDNHIIFGITLEEAKMSHLEDFAALEKYSIKYRQFWGNEEAGMASCSMDASGKESYPVIRLKATCDLKMSKALYLLKQKQKNISEMTLEVGIDNASYFSGCFQDKYGVVPPQVAV